MVMSYTVAQAGLAAALVSISIQANDLGNIGISNVGIKLFPFEEKIAELKNNTLKQLEFPPSFFLTKGRILIFLEALKDNTSLESLKFQGTIEGEITSIAQALQKHPSLKYFELQNQNLQAESYAALAAMLIALPKIESIFFTNINNSSLYILSDAV